MSEPERFEFLTLGSGQGGKLLAWHLAKTGRRVAVVERHWAPIIVKPTMRSSPSLTSVQMAILAKLPYPMVRDAIFAHPTMAEGLGVLFVNVPRAHAQPSIPDDLDLVIGGKP
jgi:choline dehydrogenase-like flavoprotein